jgi:hypothetical protein
LPGFALYCAPVASSQPQGATDGRTRSVDGDVEALVARRTSSQQRLLDSSPRREAGSAGEGPDHPGERMSSPTSWVLYVVFMWALGFLTGFGAAMLVTS